MIEVLLWLALVGLAILSLFVGAIFSVLYEIRDDLRTIRRKNGIHIIRIKTKGEEE